MALTPPRSPQDQHLPPGDGSGSLYPGGSSLDPSLGDEGEDSPSGGLLHRVTSKVWQQWLTETAPTTTTTTTNAASNGGSGGTLPNGNLPPSTGGSGTSNGGTMRLVHDYYSHENCATCVKSK